MILVLADDMTGALEVGAVFARSGLRVIVSLGARRDHAADVLVVDTETRHSTPSAAFERIVGVITAMDGTPDFVYKKTDSTLRGNIPVELSALRTVFPDWLIGYAPAYPQQGRTVMDGILYLNGSPLSETDYAHDDLNPVSTSSVRDLIGPDLRCTIFDGVTDSDVESSADVILNHPTMRIAAGPAALAAALANRLRSDTPRCTSLPAIRNCLVLSGSRTEVARLQVQYALRFGCIQQASDAAWKFVEFDAPAQFSAANVAAARAAHMVRLLYERSIDAVLIIGGDTAYAFVSALQSPLIVPIGEVLPGVAICRINDAELSLRLPNDKGDLILITKAGGFGGVDVLCQVRQILEQNAGQPSLRSYDWGHKRCRS
jgi:uncharacterized protein YgbK (DUF1537 family)